MEAFPATGATTLILRMMGRCFLRICRNYYVFNRLNGVMDSFESVNSSHEFFLAMAGWPLDHLTMQVPGW